MCKVHKYQGRVPVKDTSERALAIGSKLTAIDSYNCNPRNQSHNHKFYPQKAGQSWEI